MDVDVDVDETALPEQGERSSVRDIPHADESAVGLELDHDRILEARARPAVEQDDPPLLGSRFSLTRPGDVDDLVIVPTPRILSLNRFEGHRADRRARQTPSRTRLLLGRLQCEKKRRAEADPQDVEHPEVPVEEEGQPGHAAYNKAMPRSELEERILEVVRQEKTLPDVELTPATPLADLGIDSLDALNILFALEEAFEVTIPEEESRSIRTLGDLVHAIEKARTTPA